MVNFIEFGREVKIIFYSLNFHHSLSLNQYKPLTITSIKVNDPFLSMTTIYALVELEG